MDICDRCYGMLDAGSIETEDGRLLCAVCSRQLEYDDHCCFELDKRYEREIREGSIE